MIDAIDAELTAWVASVLPGDIAVTLAAPAAASPGPSRVGLYLLGLGNPARGRGDPLRAWEVVMRYLVTTWADEPAREHNLLGTLLAAALADGSKEVDLAPLAAEVWSAFGVAPRPCFVLQVPWRVERPAEHAPRVTEPPILRTGSGRPLTGIVLGPGAAPIAGAQVTHIGSGALTNTDHRGRFFFPLVPPATAPHRLEVSAKGMKKVVTVAEGRGEPVILTLPITEG